MKLETDKVLTPAETRVASGYTAGMIAKEIASAAGISHNTVIRHTQNIYDKAGIPRSTNALVAWFLSEKFHIDLAEFRRRVGAALLLALISVQTVCTDFSSDFVRSARVRRVEARKGGRRGRRREDENTLDITNI
jgi:DNA-binding CsgD family transcriptional regulator